MKGEKNKCQILGSRLLGKSLDAMLDAMLGAI